MRSTLKTTTAFVTASLFATIVGASSASAQTGGGTGGAGSAVTSVSPDRGLVNKLNAILPELPNAGVGRPGR